MALLLSVQNLCVCVKRNEKILKILNNVNFTVNEGEIVGLAGESGCGKSMTSLSILNLLPQNIKITEGEIIYNNRILTHLSEKEMRGIRGSEISFLFQDSKQALNPTMKVGNQITECLEIKGSTDKEKNKEAALKLLSSLGFEHPDKIFNAFPHQLSGGMCQRVMTAIAVIRRPKLLLADEPSSSLDEESQGKCLSLLMEMTKRNDKMSLLIISHDLSIIKNFCSRFLIMYAGRIVEEGQADSLFTPLHPYTHALVNSIPSKEKRGKDLVNIPGKVPSVEDNITGCPFAPRCSKAQKICKETFPPVKETENGKVYCYYPEGNLRFERSAEVPITGDANE